jgi:hypothetical protein
LKSFENVHHRNGFKDDLQNDMLQMMLKRLLILCTRVYKEQTELTTFDKKTVGHCNYKINLVESHFKTSTKSLIMPKC